MERNESKENVEGGFNRTFNMKSVINVKSLVLTFSMESFPLYLNFLDKQIY